MKKIIMNLLLNNFYCIYKENNASLERIKIKCIWRFIFN